MLIPRLTFPRTLGLRLKWLFPHVSSLQDKGILRLAAGVLLTLPRLDHRTHRAQRQGGGRPSRRQGQDGGGRLREQHHPVEHPGRRQRQRDRWAAETQTLSGFQSVGWKMSQRRKHSFLNEIPTDP